MDRKTERERQLESDRMNRKERYCGGTCTIGEGGSQRAVTKKGQSNNTAYNLFAHHDCLAWFLPVRHHCFAKPVDTAGQLKRGRLKMTWNETPQQV